MTALADLGPGLREVSARQRGGAQLIWVALVFSIFVNLLMLTGPLYMLQVYDRVLGSRSEATLVALSLLVAFLFLTMGILEYARGQVLSRVGLRLQSGLERRVFEAALDRATLDPADKSAVGALRDLEALRQFWSSGLVTALLDMPWTPIFLIAIFVFHPVIGWLALGGGALLITLALVNQRVSREPILLAHTAQVQADAMADQLRAEAELLRAMGMSRAAFDRWSVMRRAALETATLATDLSGGFSSLGRTLRMFLQSAILGLGAWLVLQNDMTGGAMIAGSILMGRALAPIEQGIGQWSILTRARAARRNLARLLTLHPVEPAKTALPRPRAVLEVEAISVLPSGGTIPILRGISFRLSPGQAMGLIGNTGAGKSTLGRALIGAQRLAAGKIRLDGALLDQYDVHERGRAFGYLPQNVTLFDATIAENISRLSARGQDSQIIAAAKAAQAHEMILKLPQGYDTPVSAGSPLLSGGQIQRIGLARALFGDPVVLVLDEPNANLDNEGSVALNAAIRQAKARGCAVIVIAHRPDAIRECDLLMMLDHGQRVAFGPREEVLKAMVQNHQQITGARVPGGIR